MWFGCKYCGYVDEVEPQYSEKQNKKYLNLKEKVRELESEVKEINEDCKEELEQRERRKEKRNKFFVLCIGIGAGIFGLGCVSNISSVLKVSLIAGGMGLLGVGVGFRYSLRLNLSSAQDFERIFKEKYPQRAESEDFWIFPYSKEIKVSRKYYGELEQKWNRSFTCRFCGEQNRFWKKS